MKDFMETGKKYMLATATVILAHDTLEERMETIDKYVRDGIIFQLYTIETRRG